MESVFLFDDRDAAAGLSLMMPIGLGMPCSCCWWRKKLKENKCEVKIRKTSERFDVELSEVSKKIQGMN